MGRQSARIYFQGKDHKEIYFNGHYHDQMYLADSKGKATLVWEKVKTEEGIEFIPWGVAYRNGIYYVLQKDTSQQTVRAESGSMVSVVSLKIYTGKTLMGLRLRHTEYYHSESGDSMRYLYFMDCGEYGLEYAFGTHPDQRGAYSTGAVIYSVYRRIPDIYAKDYGTQLTNMPGRPMQCGNFGVVFDAGGNFYWCSSSSYFNRAKSVVFHTGKNMDDFTRSYQQIGGQTRQYAEYSLSDECIHSFAFLAEDRITVCCLPYDTGIYTYAEVMEKPFYICSVSVGGSGEDIRAEDLKNKAMAYTGAASYTPMRLGTSGGESRPDMFDSTRGFLEVYGTGRRLIIDYSSCEIIKVFPPDVYMSMICLCRFGDQTFLITRRYGNQEHDYCLYYGILPELTACHINTDGSIALQGRVRNNVSYAYIESDCLYIRSGSSMIMISLLSGEYSEVELTAKYV